MLLLTAVLLQPAHARETIRVERQARLAASASAVWRLLVTPATWSRWSAAHVGFVGTPPRALRRGARFVERVRISGVAVEVRLVVDGLRPRRELVLTGRAGKVTLRTAFALVSARGGTRASVTETVRGLATARQARTMRRELERSLDRTLAALGRHA